MTELTIKRHEDGSYALLGPGIGCTGKNAEDVLLRAGKLRGFADSSTFRMGRLVEDILARKEESDVRQYDLSDVRSRVFYGEDLAELLEAMTAWLEDTGGTLLATRTDFTGDPGWTLTAFADCF